MKQSVLSEDLLEEVTPQPDKPTYLTVRVILLFILTTTHSFPMASGLDSRILKYGRENISYCPVAGCVRLGGDLFYRRTLGPVKFTPQTRSSSLVARTCTVSDCRVGRAYSIVS